MFNGPLLITGASGFIGSSTVKLLCSNYPNLLIYSVYREKYNDIFPDNVKWIRSDLCKDNLIKFLPKKIKTILHLAADSRAYYKNYDPAEQFNTNISMTNKLASYGANIGIELFVFSSSVYVYSGCSKIPFKEDFISIPTEILGASKLGCESLLKARSSSGDFKTLSYRIFTVYGPNSRNTQLLPLAIGKIKAPGLTAKFGNPNSERDFIFIDDVARGIVSGLNIDLEKEYEVMNLGTGKSWKIGQVILKLKHLLESDKKIIFSDKDIHSTATMQKACLEHTKNLSSWRPTVSLDRGLNIMVNDYNKYE